MTKLLARVVPREYSEDRSLLRTLLRWTLLGLLVRLLIMPFTMHGDLVFIHEFPYLLAYHGVVDIYGYLRQHFSDSILQGGWFYYGPLAYYTVGLWQFLLRPLMPGFEGWMALALNPLSGLLGSDSAWISAYTYRNLLLMKALYLPFDYAIGLLLLRLVDNRRSGVSAYKLWILNPLVLYGGYAMGQFDVILTFFIVWSLYHLKNTRLYPAMLALGASAALKSFPALALLPLAAIFMGKSNWQRIKLVAVGCLPLLVPMALLYIPSEGFVIRFVVPLFPLKGLTPSSLLALVFARGRQGVFLLAYLAVIAYAYFRGKATSPSQELQVLFSIVLLLIYSMIGGSFHYLVWVSPLLVLQMARIRGYWILCLLMVLAALGMTIHVKPLWGGLLIPLAPDFFTRLPTPEAIVVLFMRYNYFYRAALLAFIAISLVMILSLVWTLVPEAQRDKLRFWRNWAWFA